MGGKNSALISKTGQKSCKTRVAKEFFLPLLAPLLQRRRIILILVCVAVLQVWMAGAGLKCWPCPIKSSLGVPCPGCGLSTAMALLIRGDWEAAIFTHAFAPVFLFVFILTAVLGVLPEHLHRASVRRIGAMEKGSGFIPFLLVAMLAYWALRLPGFLQL